MDKRICLVVLINYIPFIFCVGFISLLFVMGFTGKTLILSIIYLYLLPPLLCRVMGIFFKPNGYNYTLNDSYYYYWWFTVQLQVIFLRLSILEEIIRLVPMLYSAWLRLWGAKVGKNVYWSAKATVLDKPFIEIGDRVVIGFGATLSSHYVVHNKDESFLTLANLVIEDSAVLGGESAMSTGAKLNRGELLPGRKVLLPFQEIKNGKTSFREDIDRKLGLEKNIKEN